MLAGSGRRFSSCPSARRSCCASHGPLVSFPALVGHGCYHGAPASAETLAHEQIRARRPRRHRDRAVQSTGCMRAVGAVFSAIGEALAGRRERGRSPGSARSRRSRTRGASGKRNPTHRRGHRHRRLEGARVQGGQGASRRGPRVGRWRATAARQREGRAVARAPPPASALARHGVSPAYPPIAGEPPRSADECAGAARHARLNGISRWEADTGVPRPAIPPQSATRRLRAAPWWSATARFPAARPATPRSAAWRTPTPPPS